MAKVKVPFNNDEVVVQLDSLNQGNGERRIDSYNNILVARSKEISPIQDFQTTWSDPRSKVLMIKSRSKRRMKTNIEHVNTPPPPPGIKSTGH